MSVSPISAPAASSVPPHGGVRWAELDTAPVAHVLADLGIAPETVLLAHDVERTGAGGLLLALEAGGGAGTGVWSEVRNKAERVLADDGTLLLFLYGRRTDPELALVRNALWPAFHVVALYAIGARETTRRTFTGSAKIEGGPDKVSRTHAGTLVVARRTAHAMAPDTTVAKFDTNAAAWNGNPGSAGYAHFRWMRRFVAHFARAPRGVRVLDFGSGAGWVGIEAAKRFAARELCAFDPSPEMVRLVLENARAAGVAPVVGRTGFGEDPPFPAAGEAPFELVLCSGVVSFSPDLERWLDGLCGTVAPDGELVIGDIHRDSRGFRRRRAERPLLPVRELNAYTREEIRAKLEARGFTHEASAGYQLTRPVPELMHLSATRLRGLPSAPLLWANRLASALLGARGADQFDSWVMRFRRTGAGCGTAQGRGGSESRADG